MPFLLSRFEVQDGNTKDRARIPDGAIAELKRFYYDTALAAGPQTFGALRQVADPDRILFGSDWPYCPTEMGDDMVKSLDVTLDASEKPAVDRGNALKLFPRFA